LRPLEIDCATGDRPQTLFHTDGAIEQTSTSSRTGLRGVARRRPRRRDTPIDAAIDEGWATVAAPLEFSEPVVSRVMDGVQRYIANADDRPADEVERADAALAALAAQHLSAGSAAEMYIYTTDIAAGEGAETVLASEGYGDSVTYVNGFRFIEDLVAGDS
jgi:hypothetical protein